uniref:CCHC-type domain-containing protein n=1 Tax=Caenorhabditis japonica TaxID=281687 RepID=A0A8R1HYH3_CAEJA
MAGTVFDLISQSFRLHAANFPQFFDYLKHRNQVSGEFEGQGLKGSRIHPLGRKKAVSLRCFRCGKFATHKAKSCPNVKTDAKVCYTCGSEEHVSSICPERRRKHRPEQVAAEEAEAEAARAAAEERGKDEEEDSD